MSLSLGMLAISCILFGFIFCAVFIYAFFVYGHLTDLVLAVTMGIVLILGCKLFNIAEQIPD